MDQFAPDIPAYLQGDITKLAVVAPANFPPPALGNLVVDPSKPFTLEIEWEVFGVLTGLWLTALGGSWQVAAFAESIGAGPEKRIGTASVAVTNSVPSTTNPGGVKFQATMTVPAGTLTEDDGADESGMYKLAASVFLNSNDPAGYDLTGFREGSIIRVENPV